MAKENNYLKSAWLVLLLSLLFGSALAAVQAGLKNRIEKNKEQETNRQIPKLVKGTDKVKSLMMGDLRVYRATDSDGNLVGWIIPCSGQGFSGKIELLLGVDPTASHLTGIYVLSQIETPGLGNHISDASWQAQFQGKSSAEPLKVVTADDSKKNEIQAITGATISSESVVAIINRSIKKFKTKLEERK